MKKTKEKTVSKKDNVISLNDTIAKDTIAEVEPKHKLSADDMLKAAINQKNNNKKTTGALAPEVSSGLFPPEIIMNAIEANEDGDAALFIKLFQGQRLFDHRARVWFYWNDHYWREDTAKQTMVNVQDIVDLYTEQRHRYIWNMENLSFNKKMSEDEIEKAKALYKHNIKKLKIREMQLQTLSRKKNILELSAMGVDSLGYSGLTWDTNPYLFGCRNGIIDLRTGILQDGKQDDYIKTVSPVFWEGIHTPCPRWENFFLEIFENDQEIINFMQRLFGYAISGLDIEHIYPILWGNKGRNGKGTIFKILKYILGDMGYKVPTGLLLYNHAQSGNTGPNAALMKFRGARIVWASETNKKDQIDTTRIKSLSGGDPISGRNPYESKQIEFNPTHTLFTLVNPLPRVDASDDAFWQRVILIPFNLSYVRNPDPKKTYEKKQNNKLFDQLKTEAPGILAWLVRGFLKYQAEGLNVPEKLSIVAARYRANEDLFGNFLEETCYVDLEDKKLRTKPKDLFKHYQAWCQEFGYKAWNYKHFREAAAQKFGETIKTNKTRFYQGVITIAGSVSEL